MSVLDPLSHLVAAVLAAAPDRRPSGGHPPLVADAAPAAARHTDRLALTG